jgi:hypothetical protein
MSDEMNADHPGKVPEEAAASGAPPEETPGQAPLGQGAQVELTGDAQQAARGGTHDEIVANTIARDQAIVDGHVMKGATADAVRGAVAHPHLFDQEKDEPEHHEPEHHE